MPIELDRLRAALADRYELSRELGAGGMATVYLARDLKHHRQVAVKVLRPELASSLGPERFEREIKTAANLTHPHILPLHDSGEADGFLYYVMPYIEGESLRERIDRDGALPIADALRITREVASGLSYAHRQGVIHRDIKPSNIMLADGHAVLADFGIARAIGAAGGEQVTATGITLGSPAYMSPEQALGSEQLDGRSDIYALGCVLYEMLAGVPPFAGSTAVSMMSKRIVEDPDPPSVLRGDVPAGIDQAVQRALARERDDRFQTADQFAAGITMGIESGSLPAASTGATATGVPARPAGGRLRRFPTLPTRLRSGRVAAVSVGVTALAIVATQQVLSRSLGGFSGTLDANLLAVAPFTALDPELESLARGVSDYLSRELDGAGSLKTAAPGDVAGTWTQPGDRRSATRLGRDIEAGYVVFGTMSGSIEAATISATVVDARTGEAIANIPVTGPTAEMDDLLESLAIAVLLATNSATRIGRVDGGSIDDASLPAVRAYLRGDEAFVRGKWDSALKHFGEGIAEDSTFAMAHYRYGLTNWLDKLGGTPWGPSFRKAGSFNWGLSRRDSLLVAAYADMSEARGGQLSVEERPAVAQRAYRAVTDAALNYPDDPEVWLAVGMVREELRFHIDSSRPRVLEALERAIAADSAFAPVYSEALPVAMWMGDVELTRLLATKYASMDADESTRRMASLVSALLDPATSAAEVERVMDSIPDGALQRAWFAISLLPDSAERAILISEERLERGDLLAERDIAQMRAYRGHLRESLELAGTAYSGWFPGLTGELALLGAIPEPLADSIFADWLKLADPEDSKLNLALEHSAWPWWVARGDTVAMKKYVEIADAADAATGGLLTLARADTLEAVRQLNAWVEGGGSDWVVNPVLSRLLVATGDERRALWVLDRPFPLDFPSVHRVLWTLESARVAEGLGLAEEASRSYRYVAEVWRNPDDELDPYVSEARTALERLQPAAP